MKIPIRKMFTHLVLFEYILFRNLNGQRATIINFDPRSAELVRDFEQQDMKYDSTVSLKFACKL